MTKVCSSCKQELARDQFGKNRARYDGLQNNCRVCQRVANRASYVRHRETRHAAGVRWREENTDACKVYQAAYYASRKNQTRAAHRKYYADNRERVLKRQKAYRLENPRVRAEWVANNRELVRSLARKHYRAHPEKAHAKVVHRRATKLNATPLWADHAAIAAVYAEASRRRSNGEDVHVDHTVPLRSKHVSGLHVPANLEVVEASTNRSKSNRYWPDMWEYSDG